MWAEHQSHLLGHLASVALRRLDPHLSLASSKNLSGRFWVPLFGTQIPSISLLEVEREMRRLASEAQVFGHRQISLGELQHLFPGQALKQSEGRQLSKDGQSVAGYELDGSFDFCDCQRKDLDDVRELLVCKLACLNWECHGGIFRLVGKAS